MKKQRLQAFSDKILSATFLKIFPKGTTPNQITIFRFFTVPFIAFLLLSEEYQLGIILFAVSAFTDALDGAMARTRKQITSWGIVYDPLADKLLIAVTAFLVLPLFFSPLLVFMMIFLEMVIIGLAYYYRAPNRKKMKMANWWGKSKMICQSLGVFLVMVYVLSPIFWVLIVAHWLLYASIALAVISLITYSL